jgi:hypothetical protein
MSNRLPAVTRLTIHKKDEQLVYFDSAEKAKGQIISGKACQTTLTSFFDLNLKNKRGAAGRSTCTLLYDEIPTYFWWDTSTKEWKPRKSVETAVGRIFSISYLAGKKFFLRVLLLHCKGPQSFEDLKTVDGVMQESYCKACIVLGLLINDTLYNQALCEASMFKSGFRLSQMFAMMCVHTLPSNPTRLFQNHYLALTDNASWVNMSERYKGHLTDLEQKVLGLFRLAGMFAEMGSSLKGAGIKVKASDTTLLELLLDIENKTEDVATVKLRLARNVENLNSGQHSFFDKITQGISGGVGRLHYLDGPGGTGKTFLLNTIINHSKVNDYEAVVTAWSGIAALLLHHGQTAHSAFKIPIDIRKNAECSFDRDLPGVDHLCKAKLVVWDKIVTIHKYAIEGVDKSLKALCNSKEAFGGKTVIFAGDFCQVLPVVKFDEYPLSYKASIRSLYLWDSVKKSRLKENM